MIEEPQKASNNQSREWTKLNKGEHWNKQNIQWKIA